MKPIPSNVSSADRIAIALSRIRDGSYNQSVVTSAVVMKMEGIAGGGPDTFVSVRPLDE